MPEAVLTVQEAAKRLKVTPKTIHAYVRAGKLPCSQLSPRVRIFTEEHIAEFLRRTTINLPKRVDTSGPRPIVSRPNSHQGGARFTRNSARAQRREELRSWR